MEILQLKYFFESAQCGSFAKTAEKFMVPTSSVSASVKRLESELGCSLFDRKCNKIVLNANGERLRKSLKIVFSELSQAVGSLSHNDESVGEIRMLVRSVRKKITGHIVEYKATHPEVSFKTVFDFNNKDFEEYDVIIDEKSNAYPDYVAFPLCSLRLILKSAKGKFDNSQEMSLASLKNEPFVSFGERSNTHRILVEACERAGFVPNIVVQTNDIDCHESFIESGIGIGVGFESTAKGGKGAICPLNITDFNEKYDIFCYYKADSCYGSVKHFLDFLRSKA